MKHTDHTKRQSLNRPRPKADLATIEAALKALEAHSENEEILLRGREKALKGKKSTIKYQITHTGVFLLAVMTGVFIVLCAWQLEEGRQFLNEQKEFLDLMTVADQRQDQEMILTIKQIAYYNKKRVENEMALTHTNNNPYIQLQAQTTQRLEQQQKTVTALRKQQTIKKRPVLIISVSAARLIYSPSTHRNERTVIGNVMPSELAYRAFNTDRLKQYLIQKNSLLADSMYFNTMIQTAQSHNIDPRFIFAIAGQEQGLVPRTHPSASKIANNPFNIYNSWQKYNTTIHDSSEIVCNTIANRMAKWDGHGSSVAFLNATYAEDPNWAAGVEKYYRLIKEATGE